MPGASQRHPSRQPRKTVIIIGLTLLPLHLSAISSLPPPSCGVPHQPKVYATSVNLHATSCLFTASDGQSDFLPTPRQRKTRMTPLKAPFLSMPLTLLVVTALASMLRGQKGRKL